MATLTPDAPPAISRRGATALIAAGYAAIAVGADAAAITTDSAGLVVDSVTMPNGAAGLPGYVARPAGAGRHPVVIVVNEVFGLHEYIKDVCRRLAKAGYVAIAPEFFYRNDPDRKLAQTMDFPFIMKIVGEATNAQVMGDVTTTLDWLRKQAFVAPDRLAITGFCWGGSVVWMAAAQFPQLKAGVAWYGRLAPPKTPAPGAEQRRYPIEVAPELKAPVLGLYGALDKGIPVDDVAAMQAVLKDAGTRNPAARRSTIRLYMSADHGFHADYRPSYNEADAKDGWARMLAHFKANGV